MGFPVGYTEVFFPNLFLHTLSLLGFIRTLIFSLFHLIGLSDLLESTDAVWPHHHHSDHRSPPLSAVLLRELLPVVRFSDIGESPAESCCAVCLHEFEGCDEVRRLANCRHVFHRECLDRWIDHDQNTCPLCRTSFVPDEMREHFHLRLWTSSSSSSASDDFYSEYNSL